MLETRNLAHLAWALAEWRETDLLDPASGPAVCQCPWLRWVRASSSATAAPSPEAYLADLPRTRWCGVHCLTARPYFGTFLSSRRGLLLGCGNPLTLLGPELIRTLARCSGSSSVYPDLADCLRARSCQRRAKLVRSCNPLRRSTVEDASPSTTRSAGRHMFVTMKADAGIRFSGTPLDLRDNPPRLGPASHPAATRNSMVYWAAETSSRVGSSVKQTLAT